MVNQATLDRLRALGLEGMAEALARQLEVPGEPLTLAEGIGILADAEWTHRHARRVERLLHEAKLRIRTATLAEIDYRQARGLDRSLMRGLGEGRWIEEHRSALVTGPTGIGKSFVACALANAACRLGYSARYYRTDRLLDEMTMAKADGTLSRILRRLAKVEVLVLDDWVLAPLEAPEARLVLEVMDDRIGSRSTVIASQLPVDKWHGLIQDPTLADAILDRLVHGAYRITLQGESMRRVGSHPDADG